MEDDVKEKSKVRKRCALSVTAGTTHAKEKGTNNIKWKLCSPLVDDFFL